MRRRLARRAGEGGTRRGGIASGVCAYWLDVAGGIPKPAHVNPGLQKAVDDAVHALRTELGDNLHSCCLYGSAVRGNAIEGVSDINLLVILNESTSGAHEAVARAIGGRGKIDP